MKICILNPLYRNVPAESYQSMINLVLFLNKNNYEVDIATSDKISVEEARNFLALQAIQGQEKMQWNYILWLDSDHVFTPENIMMLIHGINSEGYDILGARYIQRLDNVNEVVAYKAIGELYSPIDPESVGIKEVDAIGFGMILMKPEVLKNMNSKYGLSQFATMQILNSYKRYTEDVIWCKRVKELGYKIYIDNNVKIGHCGVVAYEKG